MIFFDLDGTLLDSNGLWLEIDKRFLEKRGITHIPDDYIEFVTSHVASSAAEFTKARFQLEESTEAIIDEWEEMAKQAYFNELPLTKGAALLLESLKKRNVEVSLLTACIPSLCYGALNNHGIAPYFKSIHAAMELGFDKRDKALFPFVANLHGKKPSQCILIDDAIDYCTAAKEAGFTVIGVQDPNSALTNPQLKTICDLFVEDLTQLDPDKLVGLLNKMEETHLATL